MDSEKVEKVNSTDTTSKKRKKCNSGITPLKDMTPEELELHIRTEIIRTMPDNISEALSVARKKPAWCSDIRWRMELKRRINVKRGVYM